MRRGKEVRFCTFTVVLSLVLACGGSGTPAAPTAEELAVFTQVMLVEAALQDFSGPTRDSLSSVYYAQVYDSFGIDAAWLDAMRDRFDADVQLWEVATDTVDARLSRHKDELSPLLRRDYRVE